MIDHFLYRYIQDRVKDLLADLLPAMVGDQVDKSIARVIRLDSKGQYLIFTDSDEQARSLVDGMRKYLDPGSMPRVAILVGKEPRFLEIGQKES